MFLERQKRVEKFTLENTSDAPVFIYVRHKLSYSDVLVKCFEMNRSVAKLYQLTLTWCFTLDWPLCVTYYIYYKCI